MNLINRAGLYLIRKRGRTFLMLCFLLFMSFGILIGSSLKDNAKKELDRLRLSMASGFTLKADIENELYREHIDFEYGGGASVYTGPMINGEMIEKICSIDGVKDYIGDLFGYTVWADLEIRPASWTDFEPVPDDPYLTEGIVKLQRQAISICPCRNGDIQKYFRTGALQMAAGRNIKKGDHFKAVISDWMAEHNHLSVGDTVTIAVKEGFYKFSDEPLKTWGEPIELEVTGLFHANFSQEASLYTSEDCLIENFIYTDMDTYIKIRENERQEGYGKNTKPDEYEKVEFLVEDPKELDSIMQQIEDWDELDLENMELVVDDADYQAAAKPYRQISAFARLLFVIGLGGFGIIFYLVTRLWMQGRRHEIGILRAIGIKKEKFWARCWQNAC